MTVVESDVEPRSRKLLEPLVDRYVFAPKTGLFNKAWAVNVGVVDAARDTPYVCVLDADILVDRHFLTRNTARLDAGDHGTHLPFRWSLSLDEESTRYAIEHRTLGGAADVPDSTLRGLLLREPRAAASGCAARSSTPSAASTSGSRGGAARTTTWWPASPRPRRWCGTTINCSISTTPGRR